MFTKALLHSWYCWKIYVILPNEALLTWLCLVRAGRRNYFLHTAVVVPTHAHSFHPHLTKFSLQCVRVIESKWRHVKHCTSVTLTEQLPAWIGVYEFDWLTFTLLLSGTCLSGSVNFTLSLTSYVPKLLLKCLLMRMIVKLNVPVRRRGNGTGYCEGW